MMLTATDISSMRIIAEQAMPGTAVVHNGTIASDSGGGHTETFAARTGGTVSCRVAPLTATEREIGGRVAADAEYVITLPAETTVETDDRIVVGAITYNVVAIRDRSWELTRRVEAKRVV